jgi:MFS family permease
VEQQPQAVGKQIISLAQDKNLWSVIVVCSLSKIAQYAVTPFLGTYQNKELGFTLTLVSALTAIGSIARAAVSRPIGRLADKTSFSHMLQFCFLAEAAGYLALAFTTPSNAHVMFVIYRLLNAVAMAGINSGCINLVYDYVAPDRRVSALALQNTVAGTAGFLTTLIAGMSVDFVQESGNLIFGLPIYAQQALAVISLILCVLIVLYLRLVVARSQRAERSDTV